MFGSDVLEVAIGLVFVYLMLALLTTAVTEALSRVLAMRSSTLLEGIQNMLSGNMTVEKDGESEIVSIWIEFYNNPLVKKLAKRNGEKLESATRGWARGKGLASYIDQRTFSLALFDILFTKNGKYVTDLRTELAKLPDDVQKPLLALLNEANDDLGKFREGVETWFNEHMERVTGWYRRKARLIAFGLGALVALLVNADTIAITNGLMRDATLRDAIVESAGALIEESAVTEIDKNITEIQKELLETQLLGWKWDIEEEETDIRARPSTVGGWFLKAIGLFITAAAVSLGAPFWFDILSKIMSVRETGKLPKEKVLDSKNGQSGQQATGVK